jgi:N-acyl-D-aspartate/D-glutamate deacylase
VTPELAIRGGMVVDGSGRAPYRADVGIALGRVVVIGADVRGDDEIDATGRLVTPGFVDVHTHYDPQVVWDPTLSPSCWHGVTSVVAGNCGYSIVPTRPEHRGTLLRTLDKVEDMRLATLEAGLTWTFESYAEYLDSVARRGCAINFGGYVGHTPVRLYVMGEAAYERAATEDELGAMRRLVADSIRGGALGFSTDRAGFHLGDGGRPVPSMAAGQDEAEALMLVTAEIGQGTVHVAPGENYHWVYDLQRRLGRRINWSAILTYPEAASSSRADYRTKLADHVQARADGADVWVQVTCRPISQEISMAEPTAFYVMPAFADLVALPTERRPALYADLRWRARAGSDIDRTGLLATRWATMPITASPSHPELVGVSLGTIAETRGRAPWDVLCDIALDDGLRTRFSITFANDDVEGVTALLRGDGCIMGLSDAGAHVGQICDAVMPTDFLANWVRDRGVMPVEQGIRKLTGEIADVVGLDRGYVREGGAADLVVLDLERLSPGPIRRVRDMPGGGERLIADQPEGIDAVVVNGVPIRRDGAALENLTRLPGTVLRSAPGPGPRDRRQ